MCHARRKRPGSAAHDQSNDLFSHCFRFELNRQRRTPDRRLCRRKTMAPNPKDFSNGFGTIWSGTPGSNRRPSPWQPACRGSRGFRLLHESPRTSRFYWGWRRAARARLHESALCFARLMCTRMCRLARGASSAGARGIWRFTGRQAGGDAPRLLNGDDLRSMRARPTAALQGWPERPEVRLPQARARHRVASREKAGWWLIFSHQLGQNPAMFTRHLLGPLRDALGDTPAAMV
jgi:hypothetical protein